jgi:hypothetical protein
LRLLVSTTASGAPQVSDADTGAILDWVYAIQFDLSPTEGPPYLWLGTPNFSSLTTINPPPANATTTPTPAATLTAQGVAAATPTSTPVA